MICNAILKDGTNCNCTVYDIGKEKCQRHLRVYDLLSDEKKKERRHQYYINNKDKINANNSKFYVNNKDRYLKKIICDCGSETASINYKAHIKTNKHKDYLEIMKYSG